MRHFQSTSQAEEINIQSSMPDRTQVYEKFKAQTRQIYLEIKFSSVEKNAYHCSVTPLIRNTKQLLIMLHNGQLLHSRFECILYDHAHVHVIVQRTRLGRWARGCPCWSILQPVRQILTCYDR